MPSTGRQRRFALLLSALPVSLVLVALSVDVVAVDDARLAAQETVSVTDDTGVEYDDRTFRQLVERYIENDGGSVDYGRWQASSDDMDALDSYVDLIAGVSPQSHPELFGSKDRARRFWINAYNALVIDAVLDYWPLDSVRDIKVSFTSRFVPGKGMFYDREVTVAGERTNLLDLEKKILETVSDPRLHFALNCASDSCPVLRASDWSEAELDDAAREFINDPENVEVSDGRLHVSRIFKWYEDEFPTDLAGYLANYADEPLRARLIRASTEGYPIRYRDYDWSLNDGGG